MLEATSRVLTPFINTLSSSLKPEDLEFIPLKGGGSKASLYRFHLNNRDFVLRLLPIQASASTRLHQIRLAKEAGRIKFGPEIYFVDQEMEGMVMEFIPGHTVQQSDFHHLKYLKNFAKFLKKLHSSALAFPQASSPFQRFHQFLQNKEQRKIALPLRFEEVKVLMEELETLHKLFPVSHVPSHLDLHPLNILFTGDRFVLVDWVNGGMCDPFFDLATFAVFLGLNESQNIFFLTEYLERKPTQIEWNRFIITKPIRLFVIAAALLSLTEIPEGTSLEEFLQSSDLPSYLDFGQRDSPYWQYGLAMYKEGLHLIDQSNFQTAMSEMKANLSCI